MLDDVSPLADAAADRAAGRPFQHLPDDEFSVLAEPGTVGAALRHIWQIAAETRGVSAKHVAAALHHRRPDLFPLLVRTTRWQLLPHVREGDSGPEAVVHRELRANADAFAALQDAARPTLNGVHYGPPAARRAALADRQPPAERTRSNSAGRPRSGPSGTTLKSLPRPV